MANVKTVSFAVLLVEPSGFVIANNSGAFGFGFSWFKSVSFSTATIARTATTASFFDRGR